MYFNFDSDFTSSTFIVKYANPVKSEVRDEVVQKYSWKVVGMSRIVVSRLASICKGYVVRRTFS